MTKNQKIWLSVFLAMFLVPEILWSPILNFYYGIIQGSFPGGHYIELRNNFLANGDYLNILRLVLIVQFLSLLAAFVVLLLSKVNKFYLKLFTLIILFIFIFAVGLVTLFTVFSNPQIG